MIQTNWSNGFRKDMTWSRLPLTRNRVKIHAFCNLNELDFVAGDSLELNLLLCNCLDCKD